MGVDGLIKNVETVCKTAKKPFTPIKIVKLKKFKGCKVAIDIPIMEFKYYKADYGDVIKRLNPFKEQPDQDGVKKRTIKKIMSAIGYFFLKHDITPVIIMEGNSSKDKKHYAGKRRADAGDKAKTNLDLFFENYKGGKTGDDEAKYMKDFDKLRALYVAASRPPKDLREELGELLKENGYTVLYARGEAEELCCELCKEGLVDAIYSNDSDTLVRKCPIAIRRMWYDEDGVGMAEVCRFKEEMLEAYDFTYETFVDYCIMLGCDYNTRVRMMQEKQIRALLSKYGRIEKIEKRVPKLLETYKTLKNIEKGHDKGKYLQQLNYKNCREIFNMYGTRSAVDCCVNSDDIELLREKVLREAPAGSRH